MEIEAKVLISPEQFIKACLAIHEQAIKKTDVYYSKFDDQEKAKEAGESLTRIRKGSDGNFLTLKKKSLEGNVESNVELETRIGNPEVIETLLKESGYKEYFTKVKDAMILESYTRGGFEVHEELVRVSDGKDKAFYALEIECVTIEGETQSEDPKDIIKERFDHYGYKGEYCKTSWMELLKK